jgi:hypothetical protein
MMAGHEERTMGITIQQAMTAREFHFNERRPNGTCYVHRRNGRTQTWKTRPGEFRIPVKYGLRDYGQITHRNADQFHLPEDCQPAEGKS